MMETRSDSFKLPYFNLPTEEEIESATEVFPNYRTWKVVPIGEHFVVKYGVNLDELKVESMIFVPKKYFNTGTDSLCRVQVQTQ